MRSLHRGSGERPTLITAVAAREMLAEANAFYAGEGRGSTVAPEDILLVDRDASGIRGLVRLCLENGVPVLRSMQVRRNLQRQGIGAKLLGDFSSLLRERGMRECWCMPYAHLEAFYGMVGFKRVPAGEERLAPLALWNRYDKHRNRRPNDPVMLMRREAP